MFQALAWRAEQQEELLVLLREKDRYREQVRQLTEQYDSLELHLLRSQGEELQLRTCLSGFPCNSHQARKSRRTRLDLCNVDTFLPQSDRSSEEEEEPTENTGKG